MNTTCEICGKTFKTTQGLRGHKTFVHQMPSSSGKPVTQLTTQQQLGELKNRLDQLEDFIGIRDPSELDLLLGITDEPVIERLEQHAHQLAELSEQLKNVSQQVKIAPSSTEISNISKQLAQLSEQVKRHEGWLTFDPVALLLSKCHHDYPAFLLNLDRLGKQVDDHQGVINLVRKKFNLIKRDRRNPT